jgi:biotin carboxyl carrier protein
MGTEQTMGKLKMTKYIAKIETEDYAVEIDRSGAVALNGEPRDTHLQNIDGDALHSLLLDNKTYEVFVQESGGAYLVTVEGQYYTVRVADERLAQAAEQRAQLQQVQPTKVTEPFASPAGHKGAPGAVTSPMTGVLIEILVGEGEKVEAGEGVAILEAMKTENVIRAPSSGTVKNVQATLGQTLRMDDVIMHIDVLES